MNLFLGRNFEQLHRAFAPIADRLRPQARPALEIRFQVLVGGKILLTLHQAEAPRVEIGKRRDLQIPRIMQRPPKLLAAAVEDRKPVRIVDRGTEVLDVLAVVRSEEEHAGHRREAGMIQIHARIDRHFDVEHGGVAGPDGETIGRRGAFAVEQGVHDDGIGAWLPASRSRTS